MATRKNVALAKPSVATKAAAKRGGTTYLPGTAIPANLSPRAATRKAKADAEVGVATQAAGVVSKADSVFKGAPQHHVRAKLPPNTKAVTVKADRLNRAAEKAGYATKPKAKVDDGMLRFGKAIIPTKRKNGNDGLDVPTIALTKVSEFAKLFAKLPKGCTVMGGARNDVNIFNRAGALIAEIRTVK